MSAAKNKKLTAFVLPAELKEEAVKTAEEFFTILSNKGASPLSSIAACAFVLSYIGEMRGIPKDQIFEVIEGFYDFSVKIQSANKATLIGMAQPQSRGEPS